MAGTTTADEVSAHSCTVIADKMTRLACYDIAFGVNAFPTALSSTTVAAPVAAASAPKAAEDAFGDTGHLKSQVSQKSTVPKRLTATVQSAVPFRRGLFRLVLDNGQIWETTQADPAVEFASNNSVTISRMMLDNYLISLTGQGRTVSVKRTR